MHKAKNVLAKVREKFRTITADNGTEFHSYERIESATGVTFYFATPHHAVAHGRGQRGTTSDFGYIKPSNGGTTLAPTVSNCVSGGVWDGSAQAAKTTVGPCNSGDGLNEF